MARKSKQVTQADYLKLIADIRVIEAKRGVVNGMQTYLSDEAVDRENVLDGGASEADADFWKQMYAAAAAQAGNQAAEYGMNINKELGYVVF